MKRRICIGLGAIGAFAFIACNVTGLSQAPRATFSQLACLDATATTA
jgi:hypothetical protein